MFRLGTGRSSQDRREAWPLVGSRGAESPVEWFHPLWCPAQPSSIGPGVETDSLSRPDSPACEPSSPPSDAHENNRQLYCRPYSGRLRNSYKSDTAFHNPLLFHFSPFLQLNKNEKKSTNNKMSDNWLRTEKSGSHKLFTHSNSQNSHSSFLPMYIYVYYINIWVCSQILYAKKKTLFLA